MASGVVACHPNNEDKSFKTREKYNDFSLLEVTIEDLIALMGKSKINALTSHKKLRSSIKTLKKLVKIDYNKI